MIFRGLLLTLALILSACSTQQTISSTSEPLDETKTIILKPNMTEPAERSVIEEIAPSRIKSKKEDSNNGFELEENEEE